MESENKQKLKHSDLAHFTGTSQYYKYLAGTVLTDGTRYLAEEGECFWLMDAIASYQMYPKVRNLQLQSWNLNINDDLSARLHLKDMHTGKQILKQDFHRAILNADFRAIEVYCRYPVIFLPSED